MQCMNELYINDKHNNFYNKIVIMNHYLQLTNYVNTLVDSPFIIC